MLKEFMSLDWSTKVLMALVVALVIVGRSIPESEKFLFLVAGVATIVAFGFCVDRNLRRQAGDE